MQADPEEGDNGETGGPHLEIHDSYSVRTVCTHAPKRPGAEPRIVILLTPALSAQFAESAGAGLAGRRPEPRPRQRQTHRSQRVPRQQVGHRGPGKQSRCEIAGLLHSSRMTVVTHVLSLCRGHALLGGLGHEMSGQL